MRSFVVKIGSATDAFWDFYETFRKFSLWKTSEQQFILISRSCKHIPQSFQIKGVPRMTLKILKLNSSSKMWFQLKSFSINFSYRSSHLESSQTSLKNALGRVYFKWSLVNQRILEPRDFIVSIELDCISLSRYFFCLHMVVIVLFHVKS